MQARFFFADNSDGRTAAAAFARRVRADGGTLATSFVVDRVFIVVPSDDAADAWALLAAEYGARSFVKYTVVGEV